MTLRQLIKEEIKRQISLKEELNWNAINNAIVKFLKTHVTKLERAVKERNSEETTTLINSILDGLSNAQTSLNLNEASGDFEGTGLWVTGRTPLDNGAIGDKIEEEGIHGIWNAREDAWFVPTKNATKTQLDKLEFKLKQLFNRAGIDATFKGKF
jgi:hypothetical protein